MFTNPSSPFSGLHYGSKLKKTYEHWQDGLLMAWRAAHWANWAFELRGYDPKNQTFLFGKGGFQGARGGPGSDWYILNVFEELDNATEYFYNRSSMTLYYFANNTEGKPPAFTDEFVAVVSNQVINATGSHMSQPIVNLTIRGIGEPAPLRVYGN